MKRILLGLCLSVGMLMVGVTNASAAYCSLDPTVGAGTPVKTSVSSSTTLLGTSTTVYASSTSSSTTFGGGIGLP
jgi:hypothetical protein